MGDYSLYVLSINCLMMGLLPFSLLIGINIFILRHLATSSSPTDRREGAMRALLFSIVGAQLVCHAPRTGLNIFAMSKALSASPISLDQPWLIDLSHLLLVVSASCNVIIYTAQDVRFRNLLVSDLKRLLLLYRKNSARIPSLEEPLSLTTVGGTSLPVATSSTRINNYPKANRDSSPPEPL